MKKNDMVRTNLYLTRLQYNCVKKEAGRREITFSEMFRKIIDRYLDNKNKGEERAKKIQ